MIDLFLVPVAIIYLLVVGMLFIYGVNFLYLTALTLRKKPAKIDLPELSEWPMVTVQLPIYNEMYVAERLIEAVTRLDYPHDKLEIQILDDSTDETAQIIELAVRRLKGEKLNMILLHRDDRRGYKAGALADGLKSAQGDYFAIFDADFIPSPDFLKKTIPYFFVPA
jgi:cellulose synthase/poly-beta-1,6-N-acetylglucosamine synthase-like glycosyltransferase